MIDGKVENVDYVTVNGHHLTPDNVVGSISALRGEYFDLPLSALPIIRESDRLIRPERERLTDTEREMLDNSMYDLSRGQVGDRRFHTEFEYYSALLRATEDNADKVAVLKRRMYATYAAVHSIYNQVFNFCLMKYGKKGMGNSDVERKAWFQENYPALFRIDELYDNFLEEVDIELERWRDFAKAASRQLTSTELSYHASGKLNTNRRGEYVS